jgi:hypothetical protein
MRVNASQRFLADACRNSLHDRIEPPGLNGLADDMQAGHQPRRHAPLEGLQLFLKFVIERHPLLLERRRHRRDDGRHEASALGLSRMAFSDEVAGVLERFFGVERLGPDGTTRGGAQQIAATAQQLDSLFQRQFSQGRLRGIDAQPQHIARWPREEIVQHLPGRTFLDG